MTRRLHINQVRPGDLLEDTRDDCYLEITQVNDCQITYRYNPLGLPTLTHTDMLDTSASDGYLPPHWRRADRREFNSYAKRFALLIH